MIGNWLAYIYNLLPLAVRQPRVGQLISALLSPAQTSINELTTYIADARLRSAATWQVMWLEKLLSDALGYPITITEGTGLPIDFIVSGVSYADETLARGLLNRYKLAGKSYVLTFADIQVVGQWLNPVCARTNEITVTGQWLYPVCAKEPEPTQTLTVLLSWTGTQQGELDGMSGTVSVLNSSYQAVTSADVAQHLKTASLEFTLPLTQGYLIDFNGLYANLGGEAVVTDILWSVNFDMSNPQTSKRTPLYIESTTIYAEVSPF